MMNRVGKVVLEPPPQVWRSDRGKLQRIWNGARVDPDLQED